MTILALEFSSPHRSVAVLRADSVVEAVETGGRGTNAFHLIERVLTESGVARGQIEVVVVGLGPGSYTGIRVAVAIAQGWQLARGTSATSGGSIAGCSRPARTYPKAAASGRMSTSASPRWRRTTGNSGNSTGSCSPSSGN